MELQWWLDNIDEMSNWIPSPTIVTEIFCDASNLGWGTAFVAFCTGFNLLAPIFMLPYIIMYLPIYLMTEQHVVFGVTMKLTCI